MMNIVKRRTGNVEATVSPEIKEEDISDNTKEAKHTMNEDTVHLQCETSLQIPGKTFEFVAVKEEIVDCLTDEHYIHFDSTENMEPCSEHPSPNGTRRLWSSQSTQDDLQKDCRKLIFASENNSSIHSMDLLLFASREISFVLQFTVQYVIYIQVEHEKT